MAQIPATEEARAAFERAVHLDPRFGEAWRNLGLLEATEERWPRAARALELAVALEPPDAWTTYRYGVALGRTGRHIEALARYEQAAALDPRFAEAWNNVAHERAALGRPQEALEPLERALAIRPAYAEARYNLGVTLQSLGRRREARIAYQLVLASEGAHADALNNLGGLCLSEAQPNLAIGFYERTLAINPKHPEARWNLGLAQLSIGDWENGWRNYEHRASAARFAQRRWDTLAGKSVLIWCEQGLGDTIQFLRYVLVLRQMGVTRIAVQCPARLAPLLRLAEGVDEVALHGEPEPRTDFAIASMSFPAALAGAIPPPGPVYNLPADRRAHWRRLLDGLGKPAAGIVWGGNPDNRAGLGRSMPLAELARLSGLTLISLQHGPQLAELSGHPEIVRWEQQDLVDTAALAAELDLVITVDTLMAHLAGTVARRTYVLLQYAADWRWMTGREDSPWYPNMRLIRQQTEGDWAGVTGRLSGLVATRPD